VAEQTLVPTDPVTPKLVAPNPVASRVSGSRRTRYLLRVLAVAYVGVLVLTPLIVVLGRTIGAGAPTFWASISDAEAMHAYQVTAIVTVFSVVINMIFGVALAILISRYDFPGRRLFNLMADVPITVSPIVVGLALILVYGVETGWFGTLLTDIGFQVIFALPGMVLATTFVSLPLVLREVLPVLDEAGTDQEQAARSLGASAAQRFWRITLPTIKWALAYGVVLSVARSLGEFGAIRVVSGAISGQTQTVTTLAASRAEQLEPGYYQLSIVLIATSALCITGISLLRPKEH
jgi:sulfate transport system permease protein